MRGSFNRRTATKVINGSTRGKNRITPTSHRGYVIDRRQPGKGYRHVVSKRDLQSFFDIIPEWESLSHRLERVVLSAGSDDSDGYHDFYHREETGAIFLHAWAEELWKELPLEYVETHQEIFQRLGVSFDPDPKREVAMCRFTEPQARAYVLLHVFMHELGHHWDHTHKKHRRTSRGEDFAEQFSNQYFDLLYPAYVRAFGDPTIGSLK
jgi:hypothetical protein